MCGNKLLKCNLRKEEKKRRKREGEMGRKELIVEGLLEKSMCRLLQKSPNMAGL